MACGLADRFSPPLLAVGGHLKNVFALARGRFAYQSQHLGDLENLTGLEFFKESLDHLMRTFEIEPETVVHDLHPGYLSTSWAKEWASERGLPLIGGAASSCACGWMHGGAWADGPVIGLCLDGTGYGTDGKIWGGEVLIRGSMALSDLRIWNMCRCRAAMLRFRSRGGWRWGSACGGVRCGAERRRYSAQSEARRALLKRMIEREIEHADDIEPGAAV